MNPLARRIASVAAAGLALLASVPTPPARSGRTFRGRDLNRKLDNLKSGKGRL